MISYSYIKGKHSLVNAIGFLVSEGTSDELVGTLNEAFSDPRWEPVRSKILWVAGSSEKVSMETIYAVGSITIKAKPSKIGVQWYTKESSEDADDWVRMFSKKLNYKFFYDLAIRRAIPIKLEIEVV